MFVKPFNWAFLTAVKQSQITAQYGWTSLCELKFELPLILSSNFVSSLKQLWKWEKASALLDSYISLGYIKRAALASWIHYPRPAFKLNMSEVVCSQGQLVKCSTCHQHQAVELPMGVKLIVKLLTRLWGLRGHNPQRGLCPMGVIPSACISDPCLPSGEQTFRFILSTPAAPPH